MEKGSRRGRVELKTVSLSRLAHAIVADTDADTDNRRSWAVKKSTRSTKAAVGVAYAERVGPFGVFQLPFKAVILGTSLATQSLSTRTYRYNLGR